MKLLERMAFWQLAKEVVIALTQVVEFPGEDVPFPVLFGDIRDVILVFPFLLLGLPYELGVAVFDDDVDRIGQAFEDYG